MSSSAMSSLSFLPPLQLPSYDTDHLDIPGSRRSSEPLFDARSTTTEESVVSLDSFRPSTPESSPHEEEKPVFPVSWTSPHFTGTGLLVSRDLRKVVYAGGFVKNRRWGPAEAQVYDRINVGWYLSGWFSNDWPMGNQRFPLKFCLNDAKEANRLANSEDPMDRNRLIFYEGVPPRLNFRNRRRYSHPMTSKDFPPLVLQDTALDRNLHLKDQGANVNTVALTSPIASSRARTLGIPSESIQRHTPEEIDRYPRMGVRVRRFSHERLELARKRPGNRLSDPTRGFESLFDAFGVLANPSARTQQDTSRIEGTFKFAGGMKYCGQIRGGAFSGWGVLQCPRCNLEIEGTFGDGVPHGLSMMRFRSSTLGEVSWKGNFIKGKMAGPGVLSTANGIIHLASDWVDDVPHGDLVKLKIAESFAKKHHIPYHMYRGSVVNGRPDKHGAMEWFHGVTGETLVYEGGFREGRRHGQGSLTKKKGGTVLYEGRWEKNVPRGFASWLLLPNGDVYVGPLAPFAERTVAEGWGSVWTRRQKPGTHYSLALSSFKASERQYTAQIGDPTSPGGESTSRSRRTLEEIGYELKYLGFLLDGKPHGRGVLIQDDGWYEGEFSDGRRHGDGQLTSAPGTLSDFPIPGEEFDQRTAVRVYSGRWRRGLPDGVGYLVDAEENKYTAEFVHGELTRTSEIKNRCLRTKYSTDELRERFRLRVILDPGVSADAENSYLGIDVPKKPSVLNLCSACLGIQLDDYRWLAHEEEEYQFHQGSTVHVRFPSVGEDSDRDSLFL